MNFLQSPAAPLATVAPTRAQMLDAFAQFLDLDVAGGAPAADTLTTYRAALNPFMAWLHLQNIAPADVKPIHVKLYRAHLRDSGKSVATIALYLTAVRRFYAAAVELELIAVNPAQNVKGGSDNTPRHQKVKALASGSLTQLLDALPNENFADKRDRLAVALMALHGLRRVEAHRLDHEHLDGETLTVSGKGAKMRKVFLRPDVLRAWNEFVAAKVARGYSDAGALFVATDNANNGARLGRRTFDRIATVALTKCGLKRSGIACHALRHTFGTLAVAGGAKVEHLRDAMGHNSIETTSIYVRAVAARENNPANFITAELMFSEEK